MLLIRSMVVYMAMALLFLIFNSLLPIGAADYPYLAPNARGALESGQKDSANRRMITIEVDSKTSVKPDCAKDLEYYKRDLQRRFKRTWFPPQNYCKQVVIGFQVHQIELHKDYPAADASNLQVLTSSGTDLFDQSALEAIKHASPFLPLPKGSPDSMNMQVLMQTSDTP